MATGVRPWLGPSSCSKLIQNKLHVLGRQILIVVIIDLNHRGIHTGSKTLHLHETEETVLCRFTDFYAKFVTNGVQDPSAVTQHAGSGGADLDVVATHRAPVEHGVEGGHFVDAHPRHAEELGDAVHGGYGQPAVLPLGQVQDWDDGRRLVGLRVVGDDGLDSFQVLRRELERNVWIVPVGVPVDEQLFTATTTACRGVKTFSRSRRSRPETEEGGAAF